MDTKVYVLVVLSIDGKGEVRRKNADVTFSLLDAEAHIAKGVENEYETWNINANWQVDVETSGLIEAIRGLRGMVEEMQEEALR